MRTSRSATWMVLGVACVLIGAIVIVVVLSSQTAGGAQRQEMVDERLLAQVEEQLNTIQERQAEVDRLVAALPKVEHKYMSIEQILQENPFLMDNARDDGLSSFQEETSDYSCVASFEDYLLAISAEEGAHRSSFMEGFQPYHINVVEHEVDPYAHGNPLSRSCNSQYASGLETKPCAYHALLLSGDYEFPASQYPGHGIPDELWSEDRSTYRKPVVNVALAPGLIRNTHPYHGPFDCDLAVANVSIVQAGDMPKQVLDFDIFVCDSVTDRVNVWNAAIEKQALQGFGKKAFYFLEADPQMEGGSAFGGLSDIDVSMNYYDWADLHSNYVEDPLTWFRNTAMPFAQKKDFVFINTNCPPHREALMTPLFERLSIDSFGGCMNNADVCDVLPQCCDVAWMNRIHNEGSQKECMVYHYKFTFALENSFVYNYTTEKMWQPLKMGSVPVYWGHSSAKQVRALPLFAYASADAGKVIPLPHAAIFMEDYSSLDALVDHLQELVEDEEKYNQFLDWKQRPHSNAFIRETESGVLRSLCNLVDGLASGLGSRLNGTETMKSIVGIEALTNGVLPEEDFNAKTLNPGMRYHAVH